MRADVKLLGRVVAARDGLVERVGRREAAQLHPAAQAAEPREAMPDGALQRDRGVGGEVVRVHGRIVHLPTHVRAEGDEKAVGWKTRRSWEPVSLSARDEDKGQP